MNPNAALITSIELYLNVRPRWVPVSEICEHFGINERDLRATSRRRPMCARFAISSQTRGSSGFKHIAHTTVAERLSYKHRCMRNLVAYARARRDYEQALRSSLDTTTVPATDAHGQCVFSVLTEPLIQKAN